MLSTANCVAIENYGFTGSPESSGDDSFISDYFDNSSPSSEDFLQQLSADLDIPLLLNPGEEEMSLLNSFLDKTPEEILSEISFTIKEEPLHTEIKMESYVTDECASIKAEDICEDNILRSKCNSRSNTMSINKYKDLCLKASKRPSKRVFHNPYVLPTYKTKIVPTPIGVPKILPRSIINNSSAKVVVLESTTIPNTAVNVKPVLNTISNTTSTVSYITSLPSQVSTAIPKVESVALNFVSLNSSQVMDEKTLKRQQRMIKNRESALLSRKRKRDYVTSLENEVHQLTEENERLKTENEELRGQLTSIKTNNTFFSLSSKTVTKALTVCAVVCVMGLNINYLQSPANSRSSSSALTAGKLLTRDHHGRNLLWAQEIPDSVSKDTYNRPNTSSNGEIGSLPVCPVYLNQSENVRLVLELHRLIGEPFNISQDFLKSINFSQSKPKPKKLKVGRYRSVPLVETPLYKMKRNKKIADSSSLNSELEVFSPYKYPSYLEFFEAINRQDDTFYLVSLSSDHLLLPALNHNKTTRPKMSLLVPSIMQNLSTTQGSTISLMQIDCEVLDTRLLHVKYGSIPHHLRFHNNATQPTHENKVDRADNVRGPVDKSHKPFFMHKAYAQFVNNTKNLL